MPLIKLNLSPKLLVLSSFLLLFSIITVAKAHNFVRYYNPHSDSEEADQTRTVGSGSRMREIYREKK
ncbi:MAG: hypothetical protein QNJ65_00840 [Xenococcaceae cyanobacterium MO_234.B1]|nr:hypothetical protein [Xenococcaceae cyanobacterium MO_234.B1]